MRRLIPVVMIVVGFSWACSDEKRTNPMSPTSPLDRITAKGYVSITIDDGWRSTYQNAIPILDSSKLKSTNYIITGRFNTADFIGSSEILSLQARGHEIGAHTRSHQDLAAMSAAQIESEIAGSRNDLLGIGVRAVETFAYPFGSYNGRISQTVQSAGFKSARATNGGFNSRTTDRFVLARQNLGSSTSLVQVQSWLDIAIKNDHWLILVAHHIDSTKTEFSITPELFREIVNEIVEKRIRVVTISEGINRFLGPA
jgi:peptidoglycan/xylan/chitin deacetylase (PgdA/CDA1 family)